MNEASMGLTQRKDSRHPSLLNPLGPYATLPSVQSSGNECLPIPLLVLL